MPARYSDARANNQLDVEHAGAASTSPATSYYGLLTTAPTDNTGTGAVEVPFTNAYARVAVTKNATNFPAAAARAIANGVALTWPAATGVWATVGAPVVGIGRYDAATAGTFCGYYDLATDKAVASGDTPQVAIGAMTATSSGA